MIDNIAQYKEILKDYNASNHPLEWVNKFIVLAIPHPIPEHLHACSGISRQMGRGLKKLHRRLQL